MNSITHHHPGTVLLKEFLTPLEISAYRLSKTTDIPQTRISQIIKGKRRITTDTALRLASFFGNSASFWLNLQNDYDLQEGKQTLRETLNKIKENAPLFPKRWHKNTNSLTP